MPDRWRRAPLVCAGVLSHCARLGMSRWYRPPTPTLYESIDEELDALEIEGVPGPALKHAAPQAWSPAVFEPQDESDDDLAEQFDENEDDMHASGIPAARGWRLDPRHADSFAFKDRVLRMFSEQLGILGWAPEHVAPGALPLVPERVTIKRITNALTNAVFFVGYDAASLPAPPTVLLRVYGAGSEALLSRRAELLILHTLSSLYEIGPHILGTFANGRVEEFYECYSIGQEGMRDLGTPRAEGPAHWVARRMREMHEVPLDVMRTILEQGDLKSTSAGFGRGIENHIMASSHRPRRQRRQPPGATSPAWQSYSYFAHPSPGLFSRRANASTMSFDSLATSYDSAASPRSTLFTPMDAPQGDSSAMSPLSLGPSDAPLQPTSHGPYPGVWRRLKRWTREASKVIELVNAFALSPEGRVVCDAHGVSSLPVSVDAPRTPRLPPAASLRATRVYFRDMMLSLLACDLSMLCREIAEYKQYVRKWEQVEGKSRRVFCHNDSQCGNLLLLRVDQHGELPAMASGMPRDHQSVVSTSPQSPVLEATRSRRRSRSRSRASEPHQRLVVIDFEYATPNPRAFDIANHFHEWRSNYLHPTYSWSLRHHGAYPTQEQRQQWLHAYVDQGQRMRRRSTSASKLCTNESVPPISDISLPPAVLSRTPSTPSFSPLTPLTPHGAQAQVDRLEQEVHVWSPATHAVWGLWGIVIARNDIETLLAHVKSHVRTTPEGLVYEDPGEPAPPCDEKGAEDFDNLRFALGRIELFREELGERGIGRRL